MKYYMGIDPGKTGAVAVIGEDGTAVVHEKYKGEIATQSDWMKEVVTEFPIHLCVLERVHSRPGNGSKASFTFGMNYGSHLATLCMLAIPHILITPQKWQKWALDAGTGETKERSLSMARRLFPEVDLKFKSDDGIADALHMARFAQNYK